MIQERAGRFYIGDTDKWFGSREKAEAFLAKSSAKSGYTAIHEARRRVESHHYVPTGRPTPDPDADPHVLAARQRVRDREQHERDGWGKNLHVGDLVYSREDIGATREDFVDEIVGGPRKKGNDTQWLVACDDGEGGSENQQWISAINLLRFDP